MNLQELKDSLITLHSNNLEAAKLKGGDYLLAVNQLKVSIENQTEQTVLPALVNVWYNESFSWGGKFKKFIRDCESLLKSYISDINFNSKLNHKTLVEMNNYIGVNSMFIHEDVCEDNIAPELILAIHQKTLADLTIEIYLDENKEYSLP